MSKAIGKTVRYTLIVIALLIAGLLAAPFFIDVNVYKQKIEQTVEDATGRKLTIGDMQATLFPSIGIELDNVHLANRPGFAERDFLSVKRLHVKLALMPLLSREVEIQHFEIDTPVVYLERRANGETNWSDLVGSPAAGESSRPAGGGGEGGHEAFSPAAPALAAESLNLNDGKITWVDGKAKPVVLSDLDVALNDVQLVRPVSVHLSGKLSGNAFELEANVGPLGDLARLDPVSLPVQGHIKTGKISLQPLRSMISGWPSQLGDIGQASVSISAQVEQRPGGIRLAEGDVQLDAAHDLGLGWKVEMSKANQLKISRAALAVDGKSLIDARGEVRHLDADPSFQLRIDSQPIERSWLTTFLPGLKRMYAGHPAPWRQIRINASLSGNSNRLKIGDLQLALDDDLLRTTGTVLFNGPDLRLNMSAGALHLDPWLPQGDLEQQQATLSLIGDAIAAADISAEPDLRFLKSWIVSARLQVGTLFMRGLEMQRFSATINGSGSRFDLSPLSFRLAGGSVTEKASLNVAAFPARWKESVHISGVQAAPLLKALAGTDMLSGTMAMDTSLRATGLTGAAVSTLNGHGKVLFRDGKLKGFDIAGAIRKFTNPAAYKQGPKETDFAQLSGSFKIINGIVDNRDLFLASPLLRVTGQGAVNLVSKTMDYHVKPRVVGTLKGQGGSMLRKGLTIPLRITGSFDDPKVRPEINARTLIDNAPALLNKGQGGALGKILGGGKQDASPAGKQQTPAEPPAKQLLKELGGMIPGF